MAVSRQLKDYLRIALRWTINNGFFVSVGVVESFCRNRVGTPLSIIRNRHLLYGRYSSIQRKFLFQLHTKISLRCHPIGIGNKCANGIFFNGCPSNSVLQCLEGSSKTAICPGIDEGHGGHRAAWQLLSGKS